MPHISPMSHNFDQNILSYRFEKFLIKKPTHRHILNINIGFYLEVIIRFMGIEESKVLERKASKTKSNLSQKSLTPEDISDFVSQLSTLACLRSTPETTYEYATFQKLPFTGHYAALPLCSTISTNYSSVFICYDCSTDDHAYLCQSCFEKGNHDSHRFSVFPNNDGWRILFCRCGDDQYMKKKTICETHIQAPKIVNQTIDKKDMMRFSVYFNQTFKVLFGLMEKRRQAQLIASVFAYLQKITEGNLYFSKVVTQFFLQKNALDGESSNLKKFISKGGLKNSRWYTIFRNLSFAPEYKIQVIKEMIYGANQGGSTGQFYELLINFTGKISILNTLAKQQNIYVTYSPQYYNLLMKTGADLTEIWKCIVRNKQISMFASAGNIIMTIIRKLEDEEEYIWQILEQLLILKNQNLNQYILACLMIQVPQYFIPSFSKQKGKNTKTNISKYEKLLSQYYSDIFFKLNTHCQGQNVPNTMLLLLPFFSFGEPMINKFWTEVEKRVQVISKNKQRKVIKQASSNVFQLIKNLLQLFMTWDHKVIRDASDMQFKSYTKDTKLVQKLLVQFFDKRPKIARQQFLNNIDQYTQKQRNLAKDVIKKNLRYNAKKGRYYNISKKLPNNSYNFDDLNIGAPLKLSEWQQFVSKKFFTSAFYRLVPAIIKIAQKALMQDIEMVKTVANIAVSVCILNKSERANMKEVTRNFIKQIPDVREDIYYILAKIRDRLELDIDDVEQSGKKGTKKAKLDVIGEIRDKKFREIKMRQQKMRTKWLKQAEKLQSESQDQHEQNICAICKQKDTDKRRFVFPCNFTRNNVISTMLHSQVTDLDINICLHKVHEDCFQSVRRKGQCPVCKFLINCYVPEKPLAEQSYTKNWLRNFQNIVTSINMQSGKSFNSDWATIFMTYLVFSQSFKVLLNSTEIQEKQRLKANQLILLHYRSQLQKWPQLTKQALKRAQKTVKGQVRRESNIKKVVKTLVLDLVLLQITSEPFKNAKRVEKKFRELINIIGTQNAEKVQSQFAWARENQAVKQIFSSNIATDVDQLFRIRNLPQKAADYLLITSIKCPMCNKYQPSTWECLFCQKISCQNCINPRNHCEVDHKGSGIILHLSNAQYELYHESRQVQIQSLYRNQYEQGWTRNQNLQGWTAHTDEIYKFFDTILHSMSPFKRRDPNQDNSDVEGEGNDRGYSNWNNQSQRIDDQQGDQHEQQPAYQQQQPQKQEQEQEQEQEQPEQQEQQEQEQQAPRAPRRPARPARPSKPAKRR